MSTRVLRAATRSSPLALWQANHVAGLLGAAHPSLRVELVPVDTEGDRRLDVPISSFGGKGVFAKEVQAAVLDGRADFAVHSAKDLPAVTVPGLVLAAVPERGDPRDALVGSTLAELVPGAVVATGSQRRRAQLARLRPDLRFIELRGNMATRLSKIPTGGAIVVAAVALERLGLDRELSQILSTDQMVPQVGQAALGIECASMATETAEMLLAIEHAPSRRRVDAERAFLIELGGDCDLPAGAHATLGGPSGPDRLDDSPDTDALITLDAFLARAGEAGADTVRTVIVGSDPVAVGTDAARAVRSALANKA